MANKSIIVVFKDGKIEKRYWTNFKECVKELELPYWTLARLKYPIKHKEYIIFKLPISKGDKK